MTAQNNTQLPDELTPEEIESYNNIAADLAKKYNVSKVHVYVGIDPVTKERVVGYLKEPNYAQKIFAMDKIATVGVFMAGEELRRSLTLKEESDPRTYSESSEFEAYKIGMVGSCVPIINVVRNSFKKK